MLLNDEEYEAMFQVEDSHWWYRHLHDRVISMLQKEKINPQARILDAGCGTGGMLQRLQKEGYQNLSGFDYNPKAVQLANRRHLGKIQVLDIRQIAQIFEPHTFDVIICNDVWYQFEDDELLPILEDLQKLIAPGGILISNNQAYDAFQGMHDVAVGAKRRFHPSFFQSWLSQNRHLSGHWVSWSRWLAPLIVSIRWIQRIQLKFGFYSTIKSDVSMPHRMINELLYQLVSLEKKWSPPRGGWGSSLFLIVRKEK